LDDTPGTGTIVEYTSTISINQFAAGDILDTNCISRVCATLEHSYVGDLSIYLELPNGQTIDFLTDHNGTGSGNGIPGFNFGIPNDFGGPGTGPDLEPGTPFRYCWTPTATTNMYTWGTTGQPNPYPETVVNADGTYVNDYAWDDFNGNGWDNAIGASINGDWTIHIQDYFASDNGFIFGWDFELCESPQVVYVDSFWVADPTTAFPNTFDADSVNREIIGVNTPTGVMDIEYHLIDNFGCEWVEELSIVTWENPEANDNAITFCTDTITIGVDDPNTTETGGRDTFDVVFSKSAPVLSAAQYVECGTEVLIEVGYVGDIGSWNVVSNTGQTITTTEVSDHLLSIESSDFGSVSITYNQCDTFATTEVVFMCELDIPNVFTPNNDPLNPLFIIPRLSEVYYDQSTFSVFNRWGVKVYENGQYGLQNNWWNGKESGNGEDLPEGVYFYELDVHNKVNNQNERYEGMINIFR